MKIIRVFLISIVLINPSFPQINWVSQPVPPGICLLLNLDFQGSNGFSGGWKFDPDFTGAGVYTTDGGNTWINSTFPSSTRVFIYTRIFSNLNGIAACAYNYDQNAEFNVKAYIEELYSKKEYTKLAFASIGDIGEVSTGGMTLKTQDGGITWQTVSVLPDSFTYVNAGYFLNENTGFVVAHTDSFYHILKTTDGGTNWNSKFTFPPGSGSMSIVFSSSDNGVATGYNLVASTQQGIIVSTNDGGENWDYQFITEIYDVDRVSFTDESTFYATGQNFMIGSVYKSTDAGLNWIPTSFNSDTMLLDGINFMQYSESGIIWGTTFSNMEIAVSKTLDGGSNWTEPEPISEYPTYSAYGSKIIDEENIYLAGGSILENSAIILKTTNAGLPVELNSFKAEVLKDNIKLTWMTGSEINNHGFEVQRSPVENEFATIGFVKGNGTTPESHSYSFTDKELPQGKYLYRLKQVDYNGSFKYSETIETSISNPEYSLEQNYPNPFNPVTTIKFTLGSKQIVSLKVYDILGNEIANLVSEERLPGTYKVDFNSAEFSSGIYFYKMQAGTFYQIRKMVLVK
jgi:photosystem II stability/assembly factor-like uncharacterized protein